jgi:excisionase family DNA binding protein
VPSHPAEPAFVLPFAAPAPPPRPRRPYTAASEPLLSVTDTAAHLRVSTKTVRRLLARGELGASRVGRQLRISRSELLAYLRRQLLEA